VYRLRGQYDQALHNYQQALVITREVGNRAGEGTTLNNIGLVYDALGQYDQALETYQQALVIHREVGNRAGEKAVIANIKSLSDN
jgi:tetratricopeptide (TPR) repeat protein